MLREKDIIVRRAMMAFDMIVISAAFLFSYFLRANLRAFYKFDIFPSDKIIGDGPAPFSE